MSEYLTNPENKPETALHQLVEKVDRLIDQEVLANRVKIYPDDSIKLAQTLGIKTPKDAAKTPSIEAEIPLRDGSKLFLERTHDLHKHASIIIRHEETFVAAEQVKHVARVLFINRWMLGSDVELGELGASWTSVEPEDISENGFEIEKELERLDEEAEQRELDADTIREFQQYLSLVR